ncbi:MAG: hypothetical protein KIS77_11930 [Saprospiraceae bacterium]|nr:hypothetical protein [Saprospiraceae bacterium]
MRVVLDTNVFLVSVLPRHKYWWVFQALLDQEYDRHIIGNLFIPTLTMTSLWTVL